MQTSEKRKPRHLRQFTVGVVGANDKTIQALSRILTVTQYRTRCYQVMTLSEKDFKKKGDVDIVIICSPNPNIVYRWESQPIKGTDNRPLVVFSRPNSALSGKYQFSSPINPSKLIKLLDQFTIKELNYLPEFEIGHDTAEIEDIAFTGIQMLRADNCSKNKSINTPQNNANRLNALVVDDSLAVRRQMQLEFELLNNNLDLAENAEQALLAVRQ